MPIEESIKIATAINNLRGPVRQHLLLSVRPTTTWREVHNIVQNFLASTWLPQEGTSRPSRMSTTSRRARAKVKEKERAKESPTTTATTTTITVTTTTVTTTTSTTTTKVKERRERTTTSSTTSSVTTTTDVEGLQQQQWQRKYNNNNHNKGKGKFGKGKRNFNNYVYNDVYCYFVAKGATMHLAAGTTPTEFSCQWTTSALRPRSTRSTCDSHSSRTSSCTQPTTTISTIYFINSVCFNTRSCSPRHHLGQLDQQWHLSC